MFYHEAFEAGRSISGVDAPICQLMAVNLSRALLDQPQWTSSVAETLRATGMFAGHLRLEVTESLAAQDRQVQQRPHELNAPGIKSALDEFGTGYTSLASPHLLPVDTVKIDRSFVSQSDTSHHHIVLIDATVKACAKKKLSILPTRNVGGPLT